MYRFCHLADDSAFERVPRPYPDLSSSKVLIAEYLRGIPISELLQALRSGRSGETERISALGINRDKLAANLFSTCLNQIFRYRFFHADLHPDNLLALPDNAVGFVDFGLCDELDETVREKQVRYLSAVYSGKVELMFKALMEIFIPSEQTEVEAFHREFLAETSTWLRWIKASSEGYSETFLSGDRSPTGQWMTKVMRLARHHRLQVPSRILSMYRALLTAESVANQLRIKSDLSSVGTQFFAKLQLEEALSILELKEIQRTFSSLLALVRDSPSQLQQMAQI